MANGTLRILLEDWIATGRLSIPEVVSAALRPKLVLVEVSPGLLEEITEGKTDDRMRVRGVAILSDTLNRKGRVYPKPIVEREVGKLQRALKKREVFGAADHPTDGKHRMPGTAAIHEKLWMQGKEVWGEATILNTGVGKDLGEFIRAKGKTGITARGLGNLTEDKCTNTKHPSPSPPSRH